MAGLIRKEEEIYENGTELVIVEGTQVMPTNPELQLLEKEFRRMYKDRTLRDINLYLYGLILKEQERLEEARAIFLEVLNVFPCFWSCWLELCKIIQN
jgi:anaphase-promoting complex subunit 8